MLQGEAGVGQAARTLRSRMSPPEIILWQARRARPSGLKFRRQHPAGPYVADFYCHEARLIVEVDGEAHGRGDRPARDAARDVWFAEREMMTLRFGAADVMKDTDAVLRQIVASAADRCSGEK